MYPFIHKWTLHLQEPNWPPLISHFWPLHVGKRIQPLHVEKRILFTPVNTSIHRWKQFKRETFKQLARYQGHHFQHYLSKIRVPSAPFDTPGLWGNDPTACTLRRKRKRYIRKKNKQFKKVDWIWTGCLNILTIHRDKSGYFCPNFKKKNNKSGTPERITDFPKFSYWVRFHRAHTQNVQGNTQMTTIQNKISTCWANFQSQTTKWRKQELD